MCDVVIDSINEHLYTVKIPNKKTLKAIANIEAGKDLVKTEGIEDLLKKLGL